MAHRRASLKWLMLIVSLVWSNQEIDSCVIYRGVYPAAENYPTHADKSFNTLVEAFRNLQVEAEESLENGDIDHEVSSCGAIGTQIKWFVLYHLLDLPQY